MTFRIDVALAAHAFHPDPGVIHVESKHITLVAVVDGMGSWGTGLETAAWTRAYLAERWRRSVPGTMEAVAGDILAACDAIPAELRDDTFGYGFSGAAVLVSAGSVQVAAAGQLAVYRVGASGAVPLFRPRMLIDGLLERGEIQAAEVDGFAHQHVCIQPLLADGGQSALVRSGPHEVPAGDAVIVAHLDLMRLLLQQAPASWVHRSALLLQDAGVKAGVPEHPVVSIRRRDRHAAR